MNTYSKSARALTVMRQRIFDYDDAGKGEQAVRVLQYLKSRKLRADRDKILPVGRYSGLTRAELRASGTCESDWY